MRGESQRDPDAPHLRILIANEREDRLTRIAEIVIALGHEVASRELEVADVAAATAREHPDLAFVGLGVSGPHALRDDRGDRQGSDVPRDRASRVRGSDLGERGGGARNLCLHRERRQQSIDEKKAFELLRDQAQRSGHKLFGVAEAVVESHMLLVPPPR